MSGMSLRQWKKNAPKLDEVTEQMVNIWLAKMPELKEPHETSQGFLAGNDKTRIRSQTNLSNFV